MKRKLLNLLLIITSLFGYLEWGQDQQMFLFQGEFEILSKLFSDPLSVMHPFTLLPLAGQTLLAITLFQKRPGKWLTIAGMASLGILLFFMFFIGLSRLNFKILFSALPFVIVCILTIRSLWKYKAESSAS